MKLTKIKDTGVYNGHSNGAKIQEIILKNEDKVKYKIYINSESFVRQSYGRLSKWDDEKGWNVITTINPKTDYNIDISYGNGHRTDAFEPIIKDFKEMIKHF